MTAKERVMARMGAEEEQKDRHYNQDLKFQQHNMTKLTDISIIH